MAAKNNITILISPLDWGLGHATRCIPIIHQLLKLQCKIIIATDGKQQNLLKTEFPQLTFVKLPGYEIAYTNSKRFFYVKIICQIPKILRSIRSERKWLANFLSQHSVDVVISDNRYGFYNPSVHSIFITHQLTIKTGFSLSEKMLRKMNFRFINRFAACWVPDEGGPVNLAGTLSHPLSLPKVPVTYLGALSRLSTIEGLTQRYKLMIVLSGPEPQRTALEQILLQQLEQVNEPVLFARGLPGSADHLAQRKNVFFKNHLSANELQQAFQQSEYIISRSGYTTVMDICKLKKKSILIPTPGQTEQEYLADHLQQQGFCISARQEGFDLLNTLHEAENFTFKFPQIDMEMYKAVVNDFVADRLANAATHDLG